MTSARDTIFSALRRALTGVAAAPRVKEEDPAAPPPATQDELAARFTERLRSVGGQVIPCASPAEAQRAIEALVRERAFAELARSEDPLAQACCESLQVPTFLGALDRPRLARCPVGLTSAQLGIAETGTLVLFSGAERHRLTSLLPETHIALLRRADLVPGLGDALSRARAGAEVPSLVTFITGPSRTGDIELKMVLGVHGPRELIVLLIDDQRP